MVLDSQNLISKHVKGNNTLQFSSVNGKISPPDDGTRLLNNNNKPIIVRKMTSINSNVSQPNSIINNCDNDVVEAVSRDLQTNSLSKSSKNGNYPKSLYLPNNQNLMSSELQGSPIQIRHQGSFKPFKHYLQDITPPGQAGSETESQNSKLFSDITSMKSWTSVGMGSTDGRKMIVRRVPVTPMELFSIVNPPT